MKIRSFLFIGFILLTQILLAQVDFAGVSDYSSVPAGQRFKVTYTLKGVSPDAFNRPSFTGFRILGQQSYSGNGGMRIVINNQVVSDNSGENKWIFTLQATTPGTYTIEPAKVKCGGKSYSSNSIKIKVTDGGSAAGASKQQNSQSNSGTKAQSSGGREAYLTVVPLKNSAYIGEAVVATYRIYTKVDITQYGISKTPSMDGFWLEELSDMSKNAKTWEEVIDGERYIIGEIRRVALYPQKSGALTVPSLEVEAILRIASRMQQDPFSMFDQFFQNPFGSDPFGSMSVRTEKRTLRSNPFTITAKALPENSPESFNGAVGNFDVSAEIDRNSCLTGDGLTLSLTVSGNGNLMLIDAPELEFPLGFQQYDPEVVDDFSKVADGISGSRRFDYLIVPESPGKYTLGPWKYSWFNPQTGAYVEKEIPAITVEVGKGNGTIRKRGGNVETDIRYIAEKTPELSKSSTFAFSPLFWILFALAWIIFAFVMYFLRKQLRLRANVAEYKNHLAVRVAKRRLKKAADFMSQNNDAMFYQELSHALWLYITDKFSLPVSELSLNNVKDVLSKNNVPDSVVGPFIDILMACDIARFTTLDNNTSMQDLYDKASNLIMDIQTSVKL